VWKINEDSLLRRIQIFSIVSLTKRKMIGASNLNLAKLVATRSSTTWKVVLRPALASHWTQATDTDNFVRYHSTVSVNKYGPPSFVEKPLKVLDSAAVERIKKELAEVDVNSDGRYVSQP
jgi:hypothetical protein